MSEFLGDKEKKEQQLKEIIKKLHDGATVAEVKKEFSRLIRNVSPEEIASMEQALISEGFPVEEVQRLCDVHVEVFESALKQSQTASPSGGKPWKIPGHPLHSFREENRMAAKLIKALKRASGKAAKKGNISTSGNEIASLLEKLSELEKHWARKENQLFPYLEKTGFTGPSSVMWGKHDELRVNLKEIKKYHAAGEAELLYESVKEFASKVTKMIFMEEKILFPNAAKRIKESQWAEIHRGESEIGYAWITPGNLWDAHLASKAPGSGSRQSAGAHPAETQPAAGTSTETALDTGSLTGEQINMMLKNLPVDLTFVDENDRVRYYSAGTHRVFPRSPAIIGRGVSKCHPPKSVHIVEKIVESFKKGEKKSAEFHLVMKGRFIHIRYFALFDDAGSYRGTIEVSQDVTDIRALEGEKRLLDW
jgi:uncharacterized protein